MKKEEQLLDQFQVEELEQRLEMGRWSAGTTSHPDPSTGTSFTEYNVKLNINI